jgi:hypothetical protein
MCRFARQAARTQAAGGLGCDDQRREQTQLQQRLAAQGLVEQQGQAQAHQGDARQRAQGGRRHARRGGSSATRAGRVGAACVATAGPPADRRRASGPAPSTSSSATHSAGPTQSPQATTRVRGGTGTGSAPTTSTRSFISAPACTVPVVSITALAPLVVTRNCGSRVSMLRKAATAWCSSAPSGASLNHASLDSVSKARAPSRAAARARPGSTLSRQIKGCTGTSRPSRRRSGSTRAPLPGCQLPAQGSRRRSAGPSSHAGTDSVSGNSRVLR